MKYLLDTHVVLWWLIEPQTIAAKARTIILNRNNKIFISSVSFWEMVVKENLGRLTLPQNMIELLKNEGFEMLPFVYEEAFAIIDLPDIHQDPFDRMLIAQAKYNDLVFITRDQKLLKYPIECIKA